ncbi:cryptochrome/photolyase family protein [Actinomadura sp. WAC 06369]|uniref:cryptochrome/photolyase family protein n=1 Tax=Actinomadura sp. WAC 06369 TaxID=2203193 RepID=UPI000F7A5258|nr:deoxyribodipyrimidine photo-lyase [Actinomadura sp. WAC 06369]RSN69347.1 deoxyribodipyrimidine photolyase [Actinomadura sp. WAC 06369]
MDTSIVLFTRDLRVRDNPALVHACRAARVVPLFVLDDAILGGRSAAPNRVRFLLDALRCLRGSLRELGGDLVVRRGDPVAHVAELAERTGAGAVALAEDRSAFAMRRLAALRGLPLEVSVHPGVTVVPPGGVAPASGDHYRVFTPYRRAWERAPRRPVAPVPEAVRVAPGVDAGPLPPLDALTSGPFSPDVPEGGERAGRGRLEAWLRRDAAVYDDVRDDLAADRTSRLSPYLRFGCVSPLELEHAAGEGFRRQLAWRDFHHQVAAAFPELPRRDYRPRGHRWNRDRDALDAWREGTTGVPIVDAGMRQLRREGFMHNRARMITASFLTRNLRVDWREGLAHFDAWLLDGDVADDAGNWQWVAGTGNDTRPNRTLSPLRQASRFDPGGDYVRAYVPELAPVAGGDVHRPWRLPEERRRALGYPPPIVDLE